jgi:hypothetical protein
MPLTPNVPTSRRPSSGRDGVCEFSHRTAGRSRRRAIGRKRRRLVRQRACGERHRALQDRSIRQRGPWRNIDAVEFAVMAWVDWLNNRRLLDPLDYVPPARCESAYYQAQRTPAAVAGLN